MTVRTIETSVTFREPFVLAGVDEVQPAGIYSVETDEELLEGISFPAYRRIATWIRLHESLARPGVVQTLKIDPDALDAALIRDAVSAGVPTDLDFPYRATDIKAKRRDREADIIAEERSEDDGMAEHPRKSDDPAAWAAERAAKGVTARR